MKDETDLDLLMLWRAGDQRAGNELFRRHFKSIRTFFVNRYPDVHEDLVQETFLIISRKPDEFRGEGTFRSYLFGVARRVGYAHLRKKYQDVPIDELRSSIAEITGQRQSAILAEREEHRLLFNALRQLPIPKQELLEMYYWQDLTAKELAAILGGLPEGTVRGRIRLALAELTKIFVELSRLPHEKDIDAGEIEQMMSALRGEVMDASVQPSPSSS